MATHADTYGIPAVTVDGNDLAAVQAAAGEAVARARSGGGPSFIEALTYRLRGHYEGDPAKYRELSEVAEWKARDPLVRTATMLIEARVLDRGGRDIARIERTARAPVQAAEEVALAGPLPAAEALTTEVYAA